jgi:hypothetical protein
MKIIILQLAVNLMLQCMMDVFSKQETYRNPPVGSGKLLHCNTPAQSSNSTGCQEEC